MPYLNITFWMLVGFTLGWLAHQWQESIQPPENTRQSIAQAALTDKDPNAADLQKKSINARAPLKQFHKILATGDAQDIIDTYTQTAQQNPTIKKELSTDLIGRVEKLIRQNDQKDAQQLLAKYMDVDPYDPYALLIQAEFYFASSRYKEALIQALEAKVYAQDITLTDRIDALIQEISGRYEKHLRQTRQWSEIAILFSMLLEKDPAHRLGERYYKLGRAQYHQGLFRQAVENLREASYDEGMQYKAQALMNLIEQLLNLDVDFLTIPISESPSGWIIPVVINDKYIANLLIDTGASITIISLQYAQSAELYQPPEEDEESAEGKEQEKILVRTASDTVEMVPIQIDSLEIGEISLKKQRVGVLDMPANNGTYDGLLGMDVLSKFDFKIDQKNEMLRFDF